MGGGGTYYDRDTTDGYQKNSRGVSAAAEKVMDRSKIDKGLLPKGRRLRCNALSPIIYGFDVTGSMGNLPMIIFDKMPMIAGQIAENDYLDDPQVSLSAVGDIQYDSAPLQMGDFSKLRNLDDWLKRIWLESGGGGNGCESYEYLAYYYARYCDIPKAKTPFFLITCDEDFKDTLYESDLVSHFGGEHETIETKKVFAELLKKFNGNVFVIRRSYGDDERITRHWESVLGKGKVIQLGSDESIADVTLGLFAVRTGSRTLEEFLKDIKTKRKVPQTDERVAEVREALKDVEPLQRNRAGKKPGANRTVRAEASEADETAPKGGRRKSKPGRI